MHSYAHPRLLSDFVQGPSHGFRSWLKHDCVVDLRKGFRGYHEFTEWGHLFAILDDDRFTICGGQGSDLCSPAVKIGPFWLGTPSGPHEALAAWVHDTTRRALRAGCSQLTRKITDDLFYDFLVAARSRWSRIFHGAVAGPLGTAYMKLATPKLNSVTCKCHKNSLTP